MSLDAAPRRPEPEVPLATLYALAVWTAQELWARLVPGRTPDDDERPWRADYA